MIDTGAAIRPSIGYGQFQALQSIDESVLLDKSTQEVNVKFSISLSSSLGSTLVNTPIGQVRFHIFNTDTPFLLSLADIDKLKVYFDNLRNILVSPQGDVLVVRRFGHPFLL